MKTFNAAATIGAVIASTTLIACQSSQNAGSNTSSNAPSNNHEFSTADAQIAHGVKVYTQSCAACHGASGQGTDDGPMLVGEGALADYHSAMDIAVFVTKNMPPKKSSKVSTSERDFWNMKASSKMLNDTDYWAVLAFALSANGVELSEPVGPHNASGMILNP